MRTEREASPLARLCVCGGRWRATGKEILADLRACGIGFTGPLVNKHGENIHERREMEERAHEDKA